MIGLNKSASKGEIKNEKVINIKEYGFGRNKAHCDGKCNMVNIHAN
jgi:hypothetical protein